MKKILVICVVLALISGCKTQKYRTEEEMYKTAHDVFENYLSDYGFNDALFASPIIGARENGAKSYKWISLPSTGCTVGVEVVVPKMKDQEPKMILIGGLEWNKFIDVYDHTFRPQIFQGRGKEKKN